MTTRIFIVPKMPFNELHNISYTLNWNVQRDHIGRPMVTFLSQPSHAWRWPHRRMVSSTPPVTRLSHDLMMCEVLAGKLGHFLYQCALVGAVMILSAICAVLLCGWLLLLMTVIR